MHTSIPKLKQKFPWWYAVIIFVVANAISILPAGYNGDEVFYNNFQQPSIAPPDWLFAPTWLFFNITSLIALVRIANAKPFTLQHRWVMGLEFLGWILFAMFNTLYFGLKSPVLGAVDTTLAFAVGLPSLLLSFRLDRTAAILILFRILWLALATYVSVYVALNNIDPFF
ncbi:MAG: TspO/MBR family protein [Trueperaceae bacterium]